LTENYRSQAVILDAAKQVIARNKPRLPRQLHARLVRGLPIEISGHQSDRQEAEMTVRRIEGLLGGASRFTVDSGWAQDEEESRRYGFGDLVILYRLNAQARLFEAALERAGLPYVTYGKKTKKDGREVVEAEDLEDFRDHLAAAPSTLKPREESVTLMTAHRAKGLEFPVVFLTGCEDGVLPYRRDGDAAFSLEEERRLFYVAMTRAKDRLFLSYAHKRFLFGKALALKPSPFVQDIEEELRRIQESANPVRKRPKGQQPELF
jgi:superfamily I DNA/RNA helicase